MCHNGKCCFFISVKTASLVYGFLIYAVTGIGVICTLGEMIRLFVTMHNGHSYVAMFRQATCALLFFWLHSKFSAKLYVGLLTNTKSLVKQHLIFAVLDNIVIFTVTIFIIQYGYVKEVAAVLALTANVIYLLLNYMVYMAYKMIDESEVEVVGEDVEQGGKDPVKKPF